MQMTTAVAVALACLLLPGAAVAARASTSAVPIVAAAQSGDVAAVQRLLQQRSVVNAGDPDGTTALHWAARLDHLELAKALLRAGADANVTNRYGVSPLSLAARAGSAPMLGLLLESGAAMPAAEAALADGQTLLMLAARTGRVDAVQLLVARTANVNAVERRDGTTAVVWAAVGDRAEAVRALTRAGADVNVRSRLTAYPHTPPAVIGDALEPGVSYVGQTVLPKGGWTPVMFAAREGAANAVRALAEAGADLDLRDADGTTALVLSIINGHFATTAALLERGADPNVADNAGMTPLYAAIDMHTLASTFGRPDLPPTVVAGSVAAVRLLLAAGANPNARLSGRVLKRVHNPGDGRLGDGATPFMRAARGADVEVMRLLLAAGADAHLTQKNGNTPILLAAGIAAERDGNNPLRGGEQDAIAAVELCLQQGVDVNAVSTSGESAVHAALGSPAMVRLLARHGAKLDIKNKQGRTPLEAAMRAREPNAELVALLQELGGRP